jgi:hypothetical protein
MDLGDVALVGVRFNEAGSKGVVSYATNRFCSTL